ncbi:tetratricopeptide repeat protein [Bradyrhizobium sp. STM 3557]|uniref:tetratricopeptide repeat protein n=1 Tax=Bradyrhizobium sp. STM 3557 TaxID=578920 RepID=UPI00388E270C
MSRQQRRTSGKSSARAASPQREQTPEALCAAALRLLQAGQPADAEAACRKALTLDAGHANALHAMGRVCLALGRQQLAIEWFARAITQDPTVADYFSDLGEALQLCGRFDEAIKAYDRALQIKPDELESWQQLGRLLQRQARLGEAAQAYDRALQLAPENAELWHQLGEVLKAQDRREEAVLAFEQVLKFELGHVDAANAAGLLHFESERYDAAIAHFDLSLQQKPDQAGVLCLKAISLRRLRRYEEAFASAERAHALAPHDPDIANSLGCILQNLGRHDDAIAAFDKAIAIRPAFAEFHNHRGTSLAELHRFDEAFASFDRAIALKPDLADAHWNAALFKLLVGDFAAGWAAREWGRKCRAVGFVERSFDALLWIADAPLAGKTILLHGDEGLGDTIQFSRYATMVAAQGARVLLEVDPVLQPLLANVSGVAACLERGRDPLPPADFHCPLSSLPLAFGTRLNTIPAAMSYLPAPDQDRLRRWEHRLGPHDRLRIGLVWSGNPAHLNDHNRSLPLHRLAPVIELDARFVSLQKDVRPADRAVLAASPAIIDLTADISDFVDTAALISCLDLVLTVDTSVAHLSAALGKPTWIMLPHTPDYRWLLGRDDSPWYPSVRLFRQDASRDYTAVIARVRAALSALLAEQR